MEPSLIGRDHEWARLSGMVNGRGGRSVVLRGVAGVGKTALLDRAAVLAEQQGHRVIRASGVEAESGLAYAGLHEMLYSLLPHLPQVDERGRAVLDAVLGRGSTSTPTVMPVGIAVLQLLSVATAEQPLLLTLDDGHWVDQASADVFGFVGRRLAGSAVTLMVAVPDDIPSPLGDITLEEITVSPLGEDDAGRLVDRSHPDLDPRVREVVLDHSRGIPLCLLEFPAHFSSARRSTTIEGFFGFHDMPLPRRLQQIYGPRIEALSQDVRHELLLGALDGAGADMADGPVRGMRYRMRDADEAVKLGLVELDELTGNLVFSHPLVWVSTVQLATPSQRRAAHAVLGDLHRANIERRAAHLAMATVDPDEEVAAVLETAATSAARHGGAAAAVSWMSRAAELSQDRQQRSRRLGDAAYIAGQAAQLDQARSLGLSDAMAGGSDSPAAVLASAYQALYEDGDVWSSQRQVIAAIETIRKDRPTEPSDGLTRLVNALCAISQYAGHDCSWERTRHLIDTLGPLAIEPSRIYADAWSDVTLHSAGMPHRIERAFTEDGNLEPWEITRLAVAAYHVDTLSTYRPHLQRTVSRELETGAVANGMTMLHLIMLDQIAAGEWTEAEQTGQRGIELATRHGHTLFAHHSRAYLALLAGLRGDLGRARDLRVDVETWARPRGVGFLTQISDAAGAAAALSEGDFETAYQHAIQITTPGTFRPYAHQAPRTVLDLVEAALHTGRSEEARLHAEAARDAGLADLSPRLALTTYGALAMTAATSKESTEMYAMAETHPAGARFPFEMARIQHAHGARLRHTRGPGPARHLLAAATETFQRLGAVGWAARADAELRAAGGSASAAPKLVSLTWQERQVAELAAAGLSNKEIATRMHMSPRTVSSHLYHVFPKLGITARAALRDALGRPSSD